MTRRRPIAIFLLLLLLGLFGAQTHHSAEGHLHAEAGSEMSCDFCQHTDSAADTASIASIECFAIPAYAVLAVSDVDTGRTLHLEHPARGPPVA